MAMISPSHIDLKEIFFQGTKKALIIPQSLYVLLIEKSETKFTKNEIV